MSSDTYDCGSIEQRINEHNLYISTIQDQLNKVDPQDPDAQNERDALSVKLNALHGQMDMLQQALENCRQGKGTDFPTFDIGSE